MKSIKFKKHTLVVIISIIMVIVFTINVFAVTIVCNEYSHVSNINLDDAGNGKETVELIMYMRPTLTTTYVGKDGYRVSNMNCYFRLLPTENYAPKYYKNMGVLYKLDVVYQLSSGSQRYVSYNAWSYLGDIADDAKDNKVYNSPSVSINIGDPDFDYQYIYYYKLTLEFRYNCTSQSEVSGEIWDYGFMSLGLGEIIKDNT